MSHLGNIFCRKKNEINRNPNHIPIGCICVCFLLLRSYLLLLLLSLLPYSYMCIYYHFICDMLDSRIYDINVGFFLLLFPRLVCFWFDAQVLFNANFAPQTDFLEAIIIIKIWQSDTHSYKKAVALCAQIDNNQMYIPICRISVGVS